MRLIRLFKSVSPFISENLVISRRIMSTPTKAAPYIGTHDGTFHCDDVTACYMLKQLERFKNHEIVRTRDQEKLDGAEIVVDVGSVLDVEKLRLDHHQRSFNQTIKDYHPNIKTTNPKAVRLSSSGLVYAIFGKDFIVTKLGLGQDYKSLDDKAKHMVDVLFDKAYIEFFEEIDAIDNGVEVASGDNFVYNYHIGSGISSRVGRLNPLDPHASYDQRISLFKRAMDMVGAELSEGILFLGQTWWPRRQKFRELMIKRKEFDPSGQILLIEDDQTIGWKSAIIELEEELGIVGQLKYIIYKDSSDQPKWRATAMPIELKSFICRVPLKQEWRGKRDEELQSASGIPDASFVHMSGFTGGAKSLDGIKSLVHKTLGLV